MKAVLRHGDRCPKELQRSYKGFVAMQEGKTYSDEYPYVFHKRLEAWSLVYTAEKNKELKKQRDKMRQQGMRKRMGL